MSKKKDLVQIIKDNPGCIAQIDNDRWTLYKVDSGENPHDYDGDYMNYEKWVGENTLASSDDDLVKLGDGGYGSGNCYGGDILQALAAICGVKVESV